MYRVYADSLLLYSDTIENLKIFNPKVTLEVNKTGSFSFTIYPEHPYYALIPKLKTIVTVYQDDFLLFRGRILNDEMGFYNEKNIECEGELAFLLDSVYRPYSFSGSITEFLTQLINSHNSQVEVAHQFTIGNVTVTDSNDTISRSSIDYDNTWDVINDKLIKLLGGYISVRHENGVNYLDYLEDFDLLSSQTVEFAKNLLDMKRIRKGEDIATALIPLGAKLTDEEGQETDERLTIKSVNEGLDYIYNQDAVDTYGWIFATNTWDDVTVASNLLTKGRAYLQSIIQSEETIELSAADLATIDSNVTSFHIGTYVRVTSNPHSIDQLFLVSKISIDLLNPASNKLTLGGVVESFTEKSTHIIEDITGIKGDKGDTGKGISNVAEYYALSTSSSAEPSSWSTSVPTMTSTNKYLWNYETITYTDNSTTDTPKKIIGVYGDRGADGTDGKGISSVTNYYLATNASSGVTPSTSGWTTTVQSVSSSAKYLWNYETITYTNNTSTSTTPCIIGAYGDTGAKGDTGAAGKDAAVKSTTAPSDTSYMWLDISVEPAILKWYNTDTSEWEAITDTSAITDAIVELDNRTTASIATSADDILARVSDSYYLKGETDQLISEVSTSVTQTASDIEIKFTDFRKDLNDAISGEDAKFSEINKYIRFDDGNIVLGEEGNELTLEITNEKISFLQGATEVAYFSDRKLYVTNVELTESGQLQLGNFAFMPRTNGNLSFKKIT